MYIRRGKVVTVAKLKKEREQDQVRYVIARIVVQLPGVDCCLQCASLFSCHDSRTQVLQGIGKTMSKKEPAKSVIHVMGCNLLGNDKGQQVCKSSNFF